ncbi:MAG TPA: hypothetical protein VII33_09390 [Nakamurella sp.]
MRSAGGGPRRARPRKDKSTRDRCSGRFVILLHLPGRHAPTSSVTPSTTAFSQVPEPLRRSPGIGTREMARDAQIGVGSATDLRGVLTGDDRVHPEPGPVPSDLARGFGVFDHWFREVPSQTFPNRSFWTRGDILGVLGERRCRTG